MYDDGEEIERDEPERLGLRGTADPQKWADAFYDSFPFINKRALLLWFAAALRAGKEHG